MADTPSKTTDAPEKLSWKLLLMLFAGAVAFVGAALILAP